MPAKNSITNDEIKTSAYSEQGRKNHDRIFAKKSAIEWAKDLNIPIDWYNYEDGEAIDTPISYSEFQLKMVWSETDSSKIVICDPDALIKATIVD